MQLKELRDAIDETEKEIQRYAGIINDQEKEIELLRKLLDRERSHGALGGRIIKELREKIRLLDAP